MLMKRKLITVLLSLFLLSFLTFSSLAAETPGSTTNTERAPDIMPPEQPPPVNFLGQDHYYSVTFRGNGEAVVNLKVVLSNLQEDQNLSLVNLRVPRVDPKDIAVYQVIRERQCVIYKSEQAEVRAEGPTAKIWTPACEQYQEPDYYQWYGEAKYQKAKHELSGDTIMIELPQPIKANASGSFVIYYRTLGYAKKNLFGAFNFIFEILKINDKIRTLQVGVTTDSDLFLRGAKGKVSYRFDEGVVALKSAEITAGAIRSPQFDNFYQQIGQGEIIKTASNLQALDSYTVRGSYADSRLRLYAKEAVFCLIILLLFSLIFILVVKLLVRNWQKKSTVVKDDLVFPILAVAGLSFVSSLFILVYTIFVFLVFQYLSNYFYQFSLILTIFLTIISIGVYSFFLFAPAVFFGFKKGLGWGIATFALTIFWLVFYLVVIFVVLFLLYQSPNYPIGGPIPLMEKLAPSGE